MVVEMYDVQTWDAVFVLWAGGYPQAKRQFVFQVSMVQIQSFLPSIYHPFYIDCSENHTESFRCLPWSLGAILEFQSDMDLYIEPDVI